MACHLEKFLDFLEARGVELTDEELSELPQDICGQTHPRRCPLCGRCWNKLPSRVGKDFVAYDAQFTREELVQEWEDAVAAALPSAARRGPGAGAAPAAAAETGATAAEAAKAAEEAPRRRSASGKDARRRRRGSPTGSPAAGPGPERGARPPPPEAAARRAEKAGELRPAGLRARVSVSSEKARRSG